MRLFVALEIPRPVVTYLVHVQQHLQRKNYPVRWVTSAAMHLTLQFLGEVEREGVPGILAALERETANLTDLPQLTLTKPGAFPNTRLPQVVWMGVGGDTPGLLRMQSLTTLALQSCGFPPQRRPFQPHLTLGRVERTANPRQRQALGDAIEQWEKTAVPASIPSWRSGLPKLFQSTLTPSGAIYRNLGP